MFVTAYVVHALVPRNVIIRNVLVQACYQLAITLWLVYDGKNTFGIDEAFLAENNFPSDVTTNEYLGCFIFNVFVACQVFNEFNARSLGDKKWVFYELYKNSVFIGVIVVTIGLQILIVEFGGEFTSTTGLTLEHWGWSIFLGCFTTPVGVLMRFIPVKEDPKSFATLYKFDTTEKSDHVSTTLAV